MRPGAGVAHPRFFNLVRPARRRAARARDGCRIEEERPKQFVAVWVGAALDLFAAAVAADGLLRVCSIARRAVSSRFSLLAHLHLRWRGTCSGSCSLADDLHPPSRDRNGLNGLWEAQGCPHPLLSRTWPCMIHFERPAAGRPARRIKEKSPLHLAQDPPTPTGPSSPRDKRRGKVEGRQV